MGPGPADVQAWCGDLLREVCKPARGLFVPVTEMVTFMTDHVRTKSYMQKSAECYEVPTLFKEILS